MDQVQCCVQPGHPVKHQVTLMASQVQLGTVRFDAFEVNLRSEELWRGLRKVRCQRQPFRVLVALLAQPGEVVSREELQQAIWGESSPADADHSLGIAINKLREALGDSAESPRFIETLSRRGYRFIAPVVVEEPELVEIAERRDEVLTRADAALGTDQPPALLITDSLTPDRLHGADLQPIAPIQAASVLPVGRYVLLAFALLLAALGGFLLARLFAARPPEPRRISQLTHNDSIFPGVQAMESFAVLAADGSRLYSSILDNGESRIASIDSATGEMEQLKLPSEIVNPMLSGISPDGSRLLVRSHLSSDAEQPVWVVPRNGGSALRVGDVNAHDAVWTPDGASVLYATGNALDAIRLEDGTKRHYATLPGRAFWMRWSPDGKVLRFTLLDPLSHTSSLWQIGLDGKPVRLLGGWTTPPSECCGVWSDDGKAYIFQSSHNGNSDLWQLRGGTPTRITNGPLNFTAPLTERGSNRLYFVGLDVRSELQRFDQTLRQFVVERGFLSAATRVSYSRDRKWVAWTDDAAHLWRANAVDGSEKVQLTPGDLQVFLAQWSPDGQHLVAMAHEPGQSWQLLLINVEGGTPRRLLNEKRNEADPTWSGDGSKVAFGRTSDLMGQEDGVKQIEVLDLATHTVQPIAGSENLFSPRWSPDGRWIAALTLGDQRLMLYDTLTHKWLPVGNVQGADPVWATDSASLYIHSAFAKQQAINQIAIPSGAVSPIVALNSPLASDKADYVFVGVSRMGEPLVRVRTATGNLYSMMLDH